MGIEITIDDALTKLRPLPSTRIGLKWMDCG